MSITIFQNNRFSYREVHEQYGRGISMATAGSCKKTMDGLKNWKTMKSIKCPFAVCYYSRLVLLNNVWEKIFFSAVIDYSSRLHSTLHLHNPIFLFWDKSLVYSPGWPEVHSEELAGLKFVGILLPPLLPNCWDYKHMPPLSAAIVSGYLWTFHKKMPWALVGCPQVPWPGKAFLGV